MRHLALVILSLSSLYACDSPKKETKTEQNSTVNSASNDAYPTEETSKRNTQSYNLQDFDQLWPIEVIKPESNDIYQKYGLEFSGFCYSCDVAEIKISKNRFDIVNICDENDVYRTENFTYTISDKELRIKTERNEFIFTKIEEAPIYKLTITGDEISLKNKRIAKLYAPQGIIEKFEVHDCGDFQG